ncbi:hypothetical protein [Geomesophilobacter sediminis]|uniref:Uncharacterized protein n=1 Tax=Geomesophilobacter sediminis TaxID=2798584 RepID=A0A8J7LYH8_9BACT|nr:hypothetical protein [Geomesophilobacter sediminis]MBJ6725101.1 hypothetical protein [Geomesophilobacter sediminis]
MERSIVTSASEKCNAGELSPIDKADLPAINSGTVGVSAKKTPFCCSYQLLF